MTIILSHKSKTNQESFHIITVGTTVFKHEKLYFCNIFFCSECSS